MNLTGIEWVRNPDGTQGYTSNPLSGCENHTPEGLCLDGLFPCYAYKLANGRLKPLYLANSVIAPFADGIRGAEFKARNDPFYPRFWEERLTPLHIPRKADSPKKGIFLCDMSELFGDWIPRSWQEQVFNAIKANPDYRFYLLTKQPQNLPQFSPFPPNCWVGVTTTGYDAFNKALDCLKRVETKVKYISIEPLLEAIPFYMERLAYCGINWLIIGACTGTWVDMANLCLRYGQLTLTSWGKKWTAQPRIEWVREIVEAADKAGVRVFLKDSLEPLFEGLLPWWALDKQTRQIFRQEMPA